MEAKNVLWLIFFSTFFPEIYPINCNKERRCKTARIHSLRTSDCYRMDLKEFPKCLPSNIEVVELSYNRIRKVTSQDLEPYSYLRHLYLTDNLIVNLDDDTFKDTTLETLDLSVNALAKVPSTVFQLPSLKTLYLSQNMNINIAESIEEAKPISHSSLTKLDISYITEDGYPTDFPDFGDFPLLAFLNISGDQFNQISTKHFAGLCNLQILSSVNVTAEFENDCDCWKINQWLTRRNVKFTALLCPVSQRDCQDQQIAEEDLQMFQKCREKFEKIERSMFLGKIGLWVGIAIGVVLLVAGILGCSKWRDMKKQREHLENTRDKIMEEKDHLQLLKKPEV